MNRNIDKTLSTLYFDISNPVGYSSAYQLYKAAKQKHKKITLKLVKWWLAGKKAYYLHKPVRRKFVTRKTIASGLNSHFQCDLAIFDAIAKYNNQNRYLLFVIDVMSR